jgi:hypothetical protein
MALILPVVLLVARFLPKIIPGCASLPGDKDRRYTYAFIGI